MGEAQKRRLRISAEAAESDETRIPLSVKTMRKLVELGGVADGAEMAARQAGSVAQATRQKQRDEVSSICEANGLDVDEGKWASTLDFKTGELVMKRMPTKGGEKATPKAETEADEASEGGG